MNRKKSTSSPAAQRAAPHGADELKARWERLHRTDREPWPDAALIAREAAAAPPFAEWLRHYGSGRKLAAALQAAWGRFHAGEFRAAIEQGASLGALGACVANRAAAVESLYTQAGNAEVMELLLAAVARGEAALEVLAAHANAHYTLALVLGRYSQRISILKAITDGLAARVRAELERTLELEPQHAEAHVALGLYNAEIVNKLGGVVASLTYGASSKDSIEHFKQALKLAPHSPIVHMEYAYGLLLLDARRYREEAQALYEVAATTEPLDAMEALDVERAKRGLAQ